MSVIVYRDGIIAADSRAFSGGSRQTGSKLKIRFMSANQCLVGVTTTKPGSAERMFQWLEWVFDRQPDIDLVQWEDQPKLSEIGELTMLVVTPAGEAYLFEDSQFPSGPLRAPFFAIGSGAHYALGAMTMGADAVQAIRTSIQCDVWCAPPVTTIDHNSCFQEIK